MRLFVINGVDQRKIQEHGPVARPVETVEATIHEPCAGIDTSTATPYGAPISALVMQPRGVVPGEDGGSRTCQVGWTASNSFRDGADRKGRQKSVDRIIGSAAECQRV